MNNFVGTINCDHLSPEVKYWIESERNIEFSVSYQRWKSLDFHDLVLFKCDFRGNVESCEIVKAARNIKKTFRGVLSRQVEQDAYGRDRIRYYTTVERQERKVQVFMISQSLICEHSESSDKSSILREGAFVEFEITDHGRELFGCRVVKLWQTKVKEG